MRSQVTCEHRRVDQLMRSLTRQSWTCSLKPIMESKAHNKSPSTGSYQGRPSGLFTTTMLASTLVTFGPGAAVEDIMTGFEGTSIILSNIPETITQEELASLRDKIPGKPSATLMPGNNRILLEFLTRSDAQAGWDSLPDITIRGITPLGQMSINEASESASSLILTKVEEQSQQRIVGTIYGPVIKALLRSGGLPFPKAELDLDIGALQVSWRGAIDTWRKIEGINKIHKAEIIQHRARKAPTTLCPICLDEPSDPTGFPCKHTHCSACIAHYISSAIASKDISFPLSCQYRTPEGEM